MKEILYTKVSKASNDLFRAEYTGVNREEVDNFLNSKLEKHTPSSFRKTRNHLLGMLGEFGILQGKGSDFSSVWTVRHYEPTLIGWLYGIYREFDHISERKRSETYFMDESPTTRLFLLSSGELRYLIGKALEENYLDKEIFGGVPVYRLPQPDIDAFVEGFING